MLKNPRTVGVLVLVGAGAFALGALTGMGGRRDVEAAQIVPDSAVSPSASATASAADASAPKPQRRKIRLGVRLDVPTYPQLSCDLSPDVPAFVPQQTEFVLTARLIDDRGRDVPMPGLRWNPAIARHGFGAWMQWGDPAQAGARSVRLRMPDESRPVWIGLTIQGGREVVYPLWSTIPARVEKRRKGNRLWVESTCLGSYPNPAKSKSRLVRSHRDLYQPPIHFLKIDSQTEDILLTPHYPLGLGVGPLNHRDATGPIKRHTMYFPPDRDLLIKVESLARRLKAQGLQFESFRINSAFRMPTFNRRVRGSAYSRHVYGNAVDLMIDENPRNARMDDLNGDGKIDRHDGLIIANACRELEAEGVVAPGGIGVYEYNDPNSVGCHIHIDARGFSTRWGAYYRGRRKFAFKWWPKGESADDVGAD